MFKPIEIVIGRGQPNDPVTGANTYNNSALAGQDLWVQLVGTGPIAYENYKVLSTGGFQLLNGLTFGSDGQAWFILTTGLSTPAAGNYSNGFQLTNVLNALMGRLGWLQPTLSGSTALTGINLQSNSGRYFNDGSFHAIVNPNIIKMVQEDGQISDADFNSLLVTLQKSAIMRCLNAVFNKREILERKMLFERFGRQDYANPVYSSPTFVGKRITAPRDFDRSMQIDSLTFFFNTTKTFNMYLFHDTQPGTPIMTIPVTAIGGQQTVINLNQFILNYSQSNKSGYYYLGYFQSDIGGAYAMNEIIEQFNELYNFGCTPVELQQIGSGINVNQIAFTIKTHGFNMQMSSFRDHTQNILMSNYLFDELIGLQMAAMVIEMIQNSLSSNNTERVTKEMTAKLYNDLNMAQPSMKNGIPYIAGIKVMIEREAERVKREFYPCKKIETNTFDTENFNPYGIPEIDLFRY